MKLGDSFAPAPQVDLMWHISNPNTRLPSPQAVDSQKAAESDLESYLTEGKTNKSLVVFMKSCKVFLYIAFGPPYLLLIKFPVAFKRFSFPLIKKANKGLLEALKKGYEKINGAMQKIAHRISGQFSRITQNVFKIAGYMKSAANKQMEFLKTEINRFLKPSLEAVKFMANLGARVSTSSLKHAQALSAKLFSLRNGLKGFSIPKIFSEGLNRLEKAYSQAAETLKTLWNLVQEGTEKAKSLLEKRLEDAKNNLNKVKDWSGKQVKKFKKQVEVFAGHVVKVADPVFTAVKVFIPLVQAVVALAQHPYFAAISMASMARGAAERSVQSVLRAMNEKMQLAKTVIFNAGNAFLMPFKRGFRFLQKHARKIADKLRQRGEWLANKFYRQGHKAKTWFMDRVRKLIARSAVIYNLIKRFFNRILHGLKLFWIWVKLMSSFAAFLIRQLFREVIASLR